MKSQLLLRIWWGPGANPHNSGIAERHWAARDPTSDTSVAHNHSFNDDDTGSLYSDSSGDTNMAGDTVIMV